MAVAVVAPTYIQEIFLQNGVHDDADEGVEEDGTHVLPSRLVEERLAPVGWMEIVRERSTQHCLRASKLNRKTFTSPTSRPDLPGTLG